MCTIPHFWCTAHFPDYVIYRGTLIFIQINDGVYSKKWLIFGLFDDINENHKIVFQNKKVFEMIIQITWILMWYEILVNMVLRYMMIQKISSYL